jgi:putative membrane protein
VTASLSGLADFFIFFVIAVALVALYLITYTLATAHNEFALIRRNVISAAVALGLSLVGFALPLASAIVHAQNVLDCVVWGLVALVVQILAYWMVRLLLPDLSQRIASGEMAAALILGAASLAARHHQCGGDDVLGPASGPGRLQEALHACRHSG